MRGLRGECVSVWPHIPLHRFYQIEDLSKYPNVERWYKALKERSVLVRGFGIDPEVFKDRDLHIHFPAGAVKKDGPSAGVTITTALISLLTQRACVSRLAMTGEMTLRGEVLPVGGVREKVVAARRMGVDPARCLVIEDTERGLVSACEAGMQCLVIPNALTETADFGRARARLGSMRELPGFLGLG